LKNLKSFVIIGLLMLAVYCGKEERPDKPNIVFIMADDLGYEGLSSNGSLSYNTPNLDKLAADGMRFTHCYSQPVCTPSRVQIMTGRYNFRNYKQFGFLDLKEKTFGHYLQDAGYVTGIAGKWQLGNGIEAPFMEGFDEYCVWQIYNNIAGKDVRGSRYADPKLYKNGQLIDGNDGLYGPDLCAEFVLDFIEKNQSRPFFIYYPMILTHDPFVPTPNSDEWEEDPFQRDTSFFRDMVVYSDSIVGLIRHKLKDLGLEDNTYLFFTGDNGTSRSIFTHTDRGIVRGGKSLTHEYGIHVPMIVYAPDRISAGQVSRALVDFTDFLPTLTSIAGIDLSKKPILDGYNLLPILHGEVDETRDFIYGYYWKRGRNPLDIKEYVRTHEYKYYRKGKLYNPEIDPEENNPLSGEDYEQIIEKMKDYMNSVRLSDMKE